MKAQQRRNALWIAVAGMLLIGAGVVSFLVLAGSNEVTLTAETYAELIRFEAYGAGSLHIRIYDMAENVLWDSDKVNMDFVDWDRTNEWGERLANGYYIYFAQAWGNAGEVVLSKTGKVILLPGDQVQLQSAPVVSGPDNSYDFSFTDSAPSYGPMAVDQDHSTESWAFGQIGIGTTSPSAPFHLNRSATAASLWITGVNDASAAAYSQMVFGAGNDLAGGYAEFLKYSVSHAQAGLFTIDNNTNKPVSINQSSSGNVYLAAGGGYVGIGTVSPSAPLHLNRSATAASFWITGLNDASGAAYSQMVFGAGSDLAGGYAEFLKYSVSHAQAGLFTIDNNTNKPVSINQSSSGNVYLAAGGGIVGIGTTNATARLTVEASSGDLIAAYNSTNRVFVVENDGTVRADGAFYSGAGDCNTGGFNAGGADVAERINTSEWAEAGDVVEIDPDHPGFFRKSSSPYSTKVAGIISTSPGVILGNSSDPVSGEWDDNRPVLAIAGRVPVKASVENGAIEIGDLLVASSVPGVAMKGDPAAAIGAVVGKAMEPLSDGEGVIMSQVMLR